MPADATAAAHTPAPAMHQTLNRGRFQGNTRRGGATNLDVHNYKTPRKRRKAYASPVGVSIRDKGYRM